MADQSESTEFLWNVHSYLNEYIRHADLKAELVIGWTSALIGVLAAGDVYGRIAFTTKGAVNASGAGLLVAAFAVGFLTIAPRLWTSQSPGYIFWRSIHAHKSKEALIESFNRQTDKDRSITSRHIYSISLRFPPQNIFGWV